MINKFGFGYHFWLQLTYFYSVFTLALPYFYRSSQLFIFYEFADRNERNTWSSVTVQKLIRFLSYTVIGSRRETVSLVLLLAHLAVPKMDQVNSRYSRKRCEICPKLTIKTPSLTLNIFHTFILLFLLLTLSKEMLAALLYW